MKGIVFTKLNKLVEEKFGLAMWDSILEEVKPPSGGVYTTAATYEDAELFSLIKKLSEKTSIKEEDLIFAYGEYLLLQLSTKYEHFFKNMGLKDFLSSIDQVVHVEVKKIYPDAGLPTFTYEYPSPNKLVMIYQSPRKLCRLAEGLISGASKFYKTPVSNEHTKCLHRGDSHCRFELTFGED